MTPTDGISSLQTILGSVSVDSTRSATATKAAEESNGAGKAAGTERLGRSKDQASLSSAGGLISQAAASSDVRMAKVTELQAAIASGTYKVSAQDVASKIVDGLLGSH